LTWSSGAFLVAILVAWYVVQLAIDHLQGRSDDHAARVLAPALGLALPLLLALRPWATYRGGVHLMALGGGLCICLALEGGRRLWLRRRWPVRAFPLAMAAVACLVPLVLLAAFPVVRTTVLTDLRRFSPDAIASTITEIRPLFMQPGAFAWRPVWETLGAAAILGPLGLVALAWLARREGRAAQGLVLVTTAVFLLATLAQNRFSYYLAMMLAVPVAVLGGLALDWALAAGRRAPLAETGGRAAKTDKATRPTATGGRRKSVPKRRGGPGGAHGRVAVAAVVLAGTAIAANLSLAVDRARRNQGLDGRWHAALSWLRQASPEPFGDPGVYVAPTAPPGRWPRPAHSVMAWWDYGYEIMRVARRAPVANPTQTGARDAALFFTETDERAALERLASFRVSHVIADMLSTFQPMGSISKWGGRFDSVIAWAGHPKDRYMSSYRARNPAGQLETLHVLHPDYYRSMAVRLFVLGGRAAIPRNSSWVVSYVDRPDGDAGKPVREVTGLRHFATYEEAVAYLLSQPRGTAEIVGLDPINPPIPIDALSSFKEVHTAPGKPPLLRVFEVATK
jgi:asparagine N-glycosylation enzyme membrane subunit Stt3